jgi:excinuclease UvrABC helicase subunit UvrB
MMILRRNNDYFNKFLNEFFGNDFNLNKDQFPKDDDKNFSKEVEELETDTHLIKNEKWTSVDGNTIYKRSVMESKVEKLQEKTIQELKSELDEAIKSENFEKAIELRDKIKKLE